MATKLERGGTQSVNEQCISNGHLKCTLQYELVGLIPAYRMSIGKTEPYQMKICQIADIGYAHSCKARETNSKWPIMYGETSPLGNCTFNGCTSFPMYGIIRL